MTRWWYIFFNLYLCFEHYFLFKILKWHDAWDVIEIYAASFLGQHQQLCKLHEGLHCCHGKSVVNGVLYFMHCQSVNKFCLWYSWFFLVVFEGCYCYSAKLLSIASFWGGHIQILRVPCLTSVMLGGGGGFAALMFHVWQNDTFPNFTISFLT